MRRAPIPALAAATLCLGLAGRASAEPFAFGGTLSVSLPPDAPALFSGSGVAEVTADGADHLASLGLGSHQITGSASVTRSGATTFPVIQSVQVSAASLGTGTLAPVSGQPPLTAQQIAVSGEVRLCIVLPGCVSTLPFPLTASGTRGVGLGGLVTASGFATAGIAVSVVGAPWTLGTAVVSYTTTGSASATTARTGFVHGPASATSSTARPSGVVQAVTPILVTTNASGLPSLPGFSTLTVHFVPEPSRLWLLGSGTVALVLLDRRRAGAQRGAR